MKKPTPQQKNDIRDPENWYEESLQGQEMLMHEGEHQADDGAMVSDINYKRPPRMRCKPSLKGVYSEEQGKVVWYRQNPETGAWEVSDDD